MDKAVEEEKEKEEEESKQSTAFGRIRQCVVIPSQSQGSPYNCQVPL